MYETPSFHRAIVIGCPGAGKSTFARSLRDLTGLPLYYLDRIFHRADHTCADEAEFNSAIDQILKRKEWIIDGNYTITLQRRIMACDAVFYLSYPIGLCLAGAESRIGKKREDMPWVEEEMDEEFRQWILDFPRRDEPVIQDLLRQYGKNKEIHVFHTRSESDCYLKELGKEFHI
jgi:adenylate kinase family enzyme